jgi:hypothetical protein
MAKIIKMKITQIELNIKELIPNPDNPRTIKDHRFKLLVKSIKSFPEMLDYRSIVVDENNMVLGGNQRYKACIDAGLQTLKVTKVVGLSGEKKKEFVIKDNANYGVWDWDSLANNWTDSALNDWGLNIWTPTIEDSFNDDDEPSEVSAVDVPAAEKEKKKVIPIEFNIEDYDEAVAIYQSLKNKGVDIAAVFTQKLSEELC